MDQIDFAEFFTTKSEANDFLSRLAAIADKVYQNDFNFEKALGQQFGVNKSDRLLTILRENNINLGTLTDVKAFLQKMQDKIATLPVLSLTIAFEPQEQTLQAVSEWFLINLKKQVVFDITVDHKLVAGATIRYNGKYSDFSIRPIVEKTLTTYISRLPKTEVKPQHQPPAQQQPTIQHQSPAQHPAQQSNHQHMQEK